MSVSIEADKETSRAKCNGCGKENECLEFYIEADNQGFYLNLLVYLCQTCVSAAFKSFDKDK